MLRCVIQEVESGRIHELPLSLSTQIFRVFGNAALDLAGDGLLPPIIRDWAWTNLFRDAPAPALRLLFSGEDVARLCDTIKKDEQ